MIGSYMKRVHMETRDVTFQQVLDAVKTLSPGEQVELIEIISRRLMERRRAEVAADIRETRADYRAGRPTSLEQRQSTADDVEESLRRQLLELLLAPVEPRAMTRQLMTYEEFLAWADEDTLAEWVDGEVVMYSPASERHQDISGFLESVLRSFVEVRQLGIVRGAPFQMKLAQSGREPDLLFVAQTNLERLKETYLDGPTDLVVEIVSPESAGQDRGDKFYEYARGGVPEYWLIDPQTEWAEFYQLEEEHYRLAFSGKEGKYYALVLPGFKLRVEWLWQEPLPSPIRTLAEIVGMDPSLAESFERALAGG
jgi:Uma2 family endonuclease